MLIEYTYKLSIVFLNATQKGLESSAGVASEESIFLKNSNWVSGPSLAIQESIWKLAFMFQG